MKYGYVRVSSKTQKISRQVVEMLRHGIEEANIIIDVQSGKDFNREGYKKLLKILVPGDILYVRSIDRFGRNYDEIIQQWTYLTKNRCVDIVVLDMPLLDTRKDKSLLSRFITDLVLLILSYMAESQRDSIRKNQEDGIKVAKASGVVFGRPRAIKKEKFRRLYKKVEAGEWSKKQLCAAAGISDGTYYKYLNEYLKEKEEEITA